jgi:hypothetical protein
MGEPTRIIAIEIDYDSDFNEVGKTGSGVEIVDDEAATAPKRDPREGEDRRDWHRHHLAGAPALLRWVGEGGIRREREVTLRDISGGGAAVAVRDEPLPANGTVRFRLATGCREEVEARVVAVSPPGQEPRMIRLEFLSPCPDEIWDLAVRDSERA